MGYVSSKVGKEGGYMGANVVTEEDKQTPPIRGWTYSDGKGNWVSDSTMVCSREVTPACSEIIVKLEGEAKEKHPELGGRYLPVKEKLNRGRWVMQHADGSQTYLRVNTGGTTWAINSTIDGKDAWIVSAAAGGICAADVKNSRSDSDNVKSWQFSDNGWKEGIIVIKCLTHT